MAVGLEADKAGELRLAEHMRPTDPDYADGRCLLAMRWAADANAMRELLAFCRTSEELLQAHTDCSSKLIDIQDLLDGERRWSQLYQSERDAAEAKLDKVRERAESYLSLAPSEDGYESCMASDNSGDIADAAVGRALGIAGRELLSIATRTDLSPLFRLRVAEEKAALALNTADDYYARIERAREWVDDAPLPWDQQTGDECRKALLAILNGETVDAEAR